MKFRAVIVCLVTVLSATAGLGVALADEHDNTGGDTRGTERACERPAGEEGRNPHCDEDGDGPGPHSAGQGPGTGANEADGAALPEEARLLDDPDGDGRTNTSGDNCPDTPNFDQADSDDDGQGDACDADNDGDGRNDTVDNCPNGHNAAQADADGDGEGDLCDSDDDDDGIPDEIDDQFADEEAQAGVALIIGAVTPEG